MPSVSGGLKSDGIFGRAQEITLVAALVVARGARCGDDPLWTNGDTDGSGGYANGVEHVFGERGALLDDFVVPPGERWRIAGFHHLHAWNEALLLGALRYLQMVGMRCDARAVATIFAD